MFKIYHFYKDELNLYGDCGNIYYLQYFLNLFGIKSSIAYVDKNTKDLEECDFIFAGGGPDLLQNSIFTDFVSKKAFVQKHINDGKPSLFICGSFQLLGKYYQTAEGEKIPGLSIFDFYTYSPSNQNKRIVGNIVSNVSFNTTPFPSSVVGFENHNGRTVLNSPLKPFSVVNLKTQGNNDSDFTEGLLYKKTIGTYFHGPLLVKNPHILFYLLKEYLPKDFKFDPRLLTSEYLSYQNAFSKNR